MLTAYGWMLTFIDSFLVDVIAEIPEADLPTDILICEVNGKALNYLVPMGWTFIP